MSEKIIRRGLSSNESEKKEFASEALPVNWQTQDDVMNDMRPGTVIEMTSVTGIVESAAKNDKNDQHIKMALSTKEGGLRYINIGADRLLDQQKELKIRQADTRRQAALKQIARQLNEDDLLPKTKKSLEKVKEKLLAEIAGFRTSSHDNKDKLDRLQEARESIWNFGIRPNATIVSRSGTERIVEEIEFSDNAPGGGLVHVLKKGAHSEKTSQEILTLQELTGAPSSLSWIKEVVPPYSIRTDNQNDPENWEIQQKRHNHIFNLGIFPGKKILNRGDDKLYTVDKVFYQTGVDGGYIVANTIDEHGNTGKDELSFNDLLQMEILSANNN